MLAKINNARKDHWIPLHGRKTHMLGSQLHSKATRTSPPWPAFDLEVSLCNLRASLCDFVPCGWIVQRACCISKPLTYFENEIKPTGCQSLEKRSASWIKVLGLSCIQKPIPVSGNQRNVTLQSGWTDIYYKFMLSLSISTENQFQNAQHDSC